MAERNIFVNPRQCGRPLAYTAKNVTRTNGYNIKNWHPMAKRKIPVNPIIYGRPSGYYSQRATNTNGANFENLSRMAQRNITVNPIIYVRPSGYTSQRAKNTNGDNFGNLPRMPERNITVNPGKYRRLLGYAAQRTTTTNGDNFENLPPMVLEAICSRLPTNQIIRLYNYQRPIFDNVAKRALRKAIENVDAEPIRIYLKWTSDTFDRVVDLLDEFVMRLTIVGSGDTVSSDRERVSVVLRKCTRLQSLGFRKFRTSSLTQDVFLLLPTLTCIDLRGVGLPLPLSKYPRMCPFQSRIVRGECVLCKSKNIILREWFLRSTHNFVRNDTSVGLMCSNCITEGTPNLIHILNAKIQEAWKGKELFKWVLMF